MKLKTLFAIACGSLLAVSQAHATGFQTVSGKVQSTYFSSPGNMPFRVRLDVPAGTCLFNVLYVDTDFPNYQAYVSGFLLAYSTGKTVQVTYEVQGNGTCKIIEYGIG